MTTCCLTSHRQRYLDAPPPPQAQTGQIEPSALCRAVSARNAALDQRLARFDLCDLGNAQRFLVRFGDDFLIFRRRWYFWNGFGWTCCGAARRRISAAEATARAIFDESRVVRGTPWGDEVVGRRNGWLVTRADTIFAWANKTAKSNYRLSCMMRMAAPHLILPGF